MLKQRRHRVAVRKLFSRRFCYLLVPSMLHLTSVPADCPVPVGHGAQITWRSVLNTCASRSDFAREGIKLALRAARYPTITRHWFSFWNSSEFLVRLAAVQPRVIKKIYRPYLFAHLTCCQRYSVLASHYEFVTQRLLAASTLRAAFSPLSLHRFHGRSGQPYRLELVAANYMEREGELVLQLVCEDVVLFSVAFTFIQLAGCVQIGVGCLQGSRTEDALERIRFSTRDLFGLRPKTLLMRVLQHIGHTHGCDTMQLVGNDNRVMLQQMRKGRVIADYDSSWLELGAHRQDDGNFLLPCEAIRSPDFAKIASNKRSEARKRHELLLTIGDETCAALGDERPFTASRKEQLTVTSPKLTST